MPGSRPSSMGSHAWAAANGLQEQRTIKPKPEDWVAPAGVCVPVRSGPTSVPQTGFGAHRPAASNHRARAPTQRPSRDKHPARAQERAWEQAGSHAQSAPRPKWTTPRNQTYIHQPTSAIAFMRSHTHTLLMPPHPPGYSRATSGSTTNADTPRHVKCRQEPEGAHRSERAPTPMRMHTDPPTLARGSKPRVIHTYSPAPMRSRAGAHTRAGTTGARQVAAWVQRASLPRPLCTGPKTACACAHPQGPTPVPK